MSTDQILQQLDESDRVAREVVDARAERRDALDAQKVALQRGTTATGWQKATARAKASRDSLDAALAAWRAANDPATRLKLNAVVRVGAWVAKVQSHHNIRCPVPNCDSKGTITDVDPADGGPMPVQCEYCAARDALREALEALLHTEPTDPTRNPEKGIEQEIALREQAVEALREAIPWLEDHRVGVASDAERYEGYDTPQARRCQDAVRELDDLIAKAEAITKEGGE